MSADSILFFIFYYYFQSWKKYGWSLLCDRGELISGWELANDKIGGKLGKKKKSTNNRSQLRVFLLLDQSGHRLGEKNKHGG